MRILKLAFFIFLLLALAGGFLWLGMQKGEIVYQGGNADISVRPIVAALFLFILTLLISALWGFVGWTIALPAKMRKSQLEAARKKSIELIGLSIAASDSGDDSESRRHAQKAHSLMSENPTHKLIYARSASAADDIGTAEKIYGELTQIAGFESVARKGLADIAAKQGNFAAAISHADAALQVSKKAVWPLEMMFKERINNADWEGAIATLDEAEKRGLVGKKTAQRRRAVILTASAHRFERQGQFENSQDRALRAQKIAPGFAPAAIMAARINQILKKDWQAASAIESAWSQEPHPALALAYKDLKAGQNKKDILKWAEGLVKLRPEHRESKILQIEDAIVNDEPALAKSILSGLLKEKPTSRILALAAQAALIENDKKAHDDYMQKAAVAPREPDWSDLDPEGNAFLYEDEDWARMVEAYGDNGVLIHPRLERFTAARTIKPISDAPARLESDAKEDFVPDDPGLDEISAHSLDNLGASEDGKKKNWIGF